MWLCGRWRTWSLVASRELDETVARLHISAYVRADCTDTCTCSTPSATFHRHPHRNAHANVQHCSTHRNTHTYAQKSWGGHPRCDLAPLTTSFGTVGQWERQHLAMAGSVHPHSPRNATAHRAAQTILHLPQWSRAKPQQVAGVRGLYGLVSPLFLFVISYVNGGFDALGIWMGCDSCYSTSTPLDPCSTSSSQRRSVRSETLAFRVQIPRILSRSALGRRCATLLLWSLVSRRILSSTYVIFPLQRF